MKNRIINITLCTTLILIFTLIFGYAFRLVRDIEAADFYHHSAITIGREFEMPAENPSEADNKEIEDAEMAKGFINKSLKESGILYDVTVDYEGHGIIVRTLTDGVTESLNEDDGAKWDSICETARECSRGWQKTLNASGMEDWHFAVVVLNDYYPKNALLICIDGRITYDCTQEEAEEWSI